MAHRKYGYGRGDSEATLCGTYWLSPQPYREYFESASFYLKTATLSNVQASGK